MKSFGMNRGVETGRGKGETGEEQRRLGYKEGGNKTKVCHNERGGRGQTGAVGKKGGFLGGGGVGGSQGTLLSI